jgi:isoprenylcysteine carboxyl methyltransferase (ICMT) family protein YpbQ
MILLVLLILMVIILLKMKKTTKRMITKRKEINFKMMKFPNFITKLEIILLKN